MIRIRIDKRASFLMGFVLLLVMPAGAHVGDRLYPIAYLTDEMVAGIELDDGSVSEWYELIGEPVITLLDFHELYGSSPDPSGFDFRIWLGWHDDPARIYVALGATDDGYIHRFDPDIAGGTVDPGIQLAVDGDHDGSAGCPCEDVVEALGYTQLYLAVAYHERGGRTLGAPVLVDEEIYYYSGEKGELKWTVLPPYGEGGGNRGGENPAISVIEFYVTPFDRFGRTNDSPVPEGSVVSDLAEGQVIGFSIVVQDVDPHDDLRITNWVPKAIPVDQGPLSYDEGDSFLDGILLPPSFGGTAVESASWGRIKATLGSGWNPEENP